MSDVRVAGLPGSLREDSYTRRATAATLSAAADLGAETDLIDLREHDLAVFDADEGAAPALTERVRAADAVCLGTPMYHGSYSSPLKTALDYCGFEEFEDKTVGLLAVAGGSFPVTALEHLRSVCRALNAWVLPHQVAIPRADAAFDDGRIVDEDLRRRVEVLGERLVRYATIEPDPDSFESGQNVGARSE